MKGADGHRVVYLPGLMTDNPGMDVEEYRKQLAYLDPVTRKQLEEGDWDVQLSGGVLDVTKLKYFTAGEFSQRGGDGEQGETGPRGPHPRRLGGVPGGSGVVSRAKDGERPLIDQAVAGNSPVYGPGWEFPLVVAQGVAGKPGLFLPGRTVYFCPFQPGVQQDDALRLR